MAELEPKRQRVKLKIECKKTKCLDNKHCFLDPPKLQNKRQEMASPKPSDATNAQQIAASSDNVRSIPERCCWNCGIKLIDWGRTHALDIEDIEYIVSSLKHECIRHEFWCKAIDLLAVNNARRRGRRRMPEYAQKRIRTSVGAAKPLKDGFQTRGEGDVLFYAQHATATCCRSCMEAWYGIPKGRELTENEIRFCTGLLMRYVDERMPHLNKEPEKVPSIRKPKKNEPR